MDVNAGLQVATRERESSLKLSSQLSKHNPTIFYRKIRVSLKKECEREEKKRYSAVLAVCLRTVSGCGTVL